MKEVQWRAKRAIAREKVFVNDYGRDLRGPAQNKFGGHRTQRLRTYGGNFGAAGPMRKLTPAEVKAIEDELKNKGRL